MIYLLDDEPDTLVSIKQALHFAGVSNTSIMTHWLECFEAMKECPPTLLFLDLFMPDYDGEDLLPIIFKEWPNLPVIIITGDHNIQRAVRCIKAGAVEYVTKPIDIDLLMVLIRSYLYKEEQVVLKPKVALAELYLWYDTLFTECNYSDDLLLANLKKWVEGEEWRSPTTTLRSLVDSMQSNTSYVSRCINQTWGCTFPVWLGKIRLVAFFRSYNENFLHSVEGIAFECGFASRSPFYDTLKREIGVSLRELKELE